jgi:hypothetical protein
MPQILIPDLVLALAGGSANRVEFLPKYPTEDRLYTVSFAGKLGPTETLETGSVTCELFSGTDSSPHNLVYGGTSITSPYATQIIRGGLAGNLYTLVWTGITNLGRTLVIVGQLPVLPFGAL